MRRVAESARQLFTGLIPAEPGWRAIVTDGKTTYLVPIVGWAWERTVWRDGDQFSVDPLDGEPFVAGVEGQHAATVSDLISTMAGKDWRCDGVLAPGKSLGDPNADGWETIEHAEPETE
jgi:hypothetical protein